MKLSIRWKLMIFVAGINLIISGVLAFTIYKVSYNMFYNNFFENKYTFVSTLAKSIDGELHKTFTNLDATKTYEYKRLQNYLSKILKNDTTISYLYTLNYDKKRDEFTYCIDADISTENTFWCESDFFAFEIHFDSLNNPFFYYNQKKYNQKLTINFEKTSFSVIYKEIDNKKVFFINEKVFLELTNTEPFILKIDTLFLDSVNRFVNSKLELKDRIIDIHTSLSFKNEPFSTPGDLMVETPENIKKYKEILRNNKDFIDIKLQESIYGKCYSAYGIIRDFSNEPIGIVCLDIYANEFNSFKKSIRNITAIFAIISVLLILILIPILLEHIVIKKIMKLYDGIQKIKNKEMDTQIQISSKDEFETLASGFNEMTINLKQFYENLEQKVKERTATIELQKEELETQSENLKEVNNTLSIKNELLNQQKEEILTQKDSLENATKEIIKQQKILETSHNQTLASINYASLIQQAVLPKQDLILQIIPNNFIIFKPRDIVSGDFYYFKIVKNNIFIAAADCTGHGVPGAFMSMLGMAFINEIVIKDEYNTAAKILDELRNQIKKSLQQTGERDEQKDGIDIAFCIINLESLDLNFAGAYNPCWIVRNNKTTKNKLSDSNFQLTILEADRQPVGVYIKEKPFKDNFFQLENDDIFYIFSDGYTSQLNGITNETYKTKRLKNIILEISPLPLIEQKQIL